MSPVTPDQVAFIVWGPPELGPRSTVLARELGLRPPAFLSSVTRRGWLAAPAKYAYQALATVRLLRRDRPRVVVVQSPPSWAVAVVGIDARLRGTRYLVDAHSAAFTERIWRWPGPFHALFTRAAIATLVTGEVLARAVRADGGRAIILADIPTDFDVPLVRHPEGPFTVAVVNTFAADEPLDALIEAAGRHPAVQFRITGRVGPARGATVAAAPPNVAFTGFLPDAEYHRLLAGAHAVACLTTRDHTMQRGACEALSLERPILTSDWPILRAYFERGTVHVANTPDGIADGIGRLVEGYERLNTEIADLAALRRREWTARRAQLRTLIGLTPDDDAR